MQGRLSFLGVRLVEVGTAKEIEVAFAQVLTQLPVHVTVGLVTEERGRCGVCDGY